MRKKIKSRVAAFLLSLQVFFSLVSPVQPFLNVVRAMENKAASFEIVDGALRVSGVNNDAYSYFFVDKNGVLQASTGDISNNELMMTWLSQSGEDLIDLQPQRVVLKTLTGSHHLEIAGEQAHLLASSSEQSLELSQADRDFLFDVWQTDADNRSSVTTSNVLVGQTYRFPLQPEVQVTFSRLPEQSSKLTIKEIELSVEQQVELGAVSSLAYDITTQMNDGEFAFDLVLPKAATDEKVEVKYAENLAELVKADSADNELIVNDEKVTVKNLDHMTIFVVVSPLPATINNGDICTVDLTGVCYDSIQAAVDAANPSDVLHLKSDMVLSSRVQVNKSLTIEGDGFTVYPNFAKTSNSNNAAFGILSDDVTLRNFTIGGVGGTSLHGINTYKVTGVLLDGLTIKNNDSSAVTVNGSTVTVNNITTSGNGWGGINVDQGGGVTTPANLIVQGFSSHNETAHIWMDDFNKDVHVSDLLSQYQSADVGPKRFFVLEKNVPSMSAIKMFVSPDGIKPFVESSFVNVGQHVRIEVEAQDDVAVKHVEFRIQNKTTGAYVAPRVYEAASIGGNVYRYEFVVPTDGKYINTHGNMSQLLNEHRFWARAYDYAGNYNHGISGEFTFDATVPNLNVTYNGGVMADGKLRVKSINDLTYDGIYTDNSSGLNRTSFVIWTVDPDTLQPVVYPGNSTSHLCNWNGSSANISALNGTNSDSLNDVALSSCTSHAPSGWSYPEGTYRIAHVVYDDADNQKYSGTSYFVIDNTSPAQPTGLSFKSTDRQSSYACGAMMPRQPVVPVWDANVESDFSHYEYTSFHPNGAIGLNEQSLFVPELDNSWMPPTDGAYGFVVRSVDESGNKSDWALSDKSLDGSCQVIYDGVAPTGSIDYLYYSSKDVTSTSFITNDRNPVLGGACADGVGLDTVTLTLNGEVQTVTCNSGEWRSAPSSTLADGEYTATLLLTDLAGNQTTVTQELRVDSVAPAATHTFYRDGEVLGSGVTAHVNSLARLSFTGEYVDNAPSSLLRWDSFVIFEAQDNGSFAFSQNGKRAFCGWRSMPNLVELSGASFSLSEQRLFTDCVGSVDDGTYYMAHHIYDWATRKDIPSITQFRDVLGLKFVVDTLVPSSTIESPAADTYHNKPIEIVGNTTDANGVVQVNLSAALYEEGACGEYQNIATLNPESVTNDYDWAYTWTPEAEASYCLKAQGVDQADNVEQSAVVMNVIFDQTLPEVSLSIDPASPDAANGWYKTQPVVTLDHSDDRATDYIQYQWNGEADGGWQAYAGSFSPSSEGSQVLYYRAVDRAGNISLVGNQTISFDQTKPTAPLGVDADPESSSGPDAKVTWEAATDNVAVDRYVVTWDLLDGDEDFSQEVSASTREAETDQLDSDGTWRVTVTAYDRAGHSNSASDDIEVGNEASSPVVLGVSQTGAGLVPAAQVLGVDTQEVDLEEEEQSAAEEAQASVTDNGGQVQGASTSCEPISSYLWLIMLLVQLAALCLAEYKLSKKQNKWKWLVYALATIVPAVAVHYLVDVSCFDNGVLRFVTSYFYLFTAAVSAVFKTLAYLIIDEN